MAFAARHPLAGLRAPWNAEWAAGRVDGSPLHPWHGLGAISRVGFAVVLYADRGGLGPGLTVARNAMLRAQIAETRTEGPNHG